MRVVRQSVEGDHPTPGRGQAIAPTMDGPGKPLRRQRRGAWTTLVVALPRSLCFLVLLHSHCHSPVKSCKGGCGEVRSGDSCGRPGVD